jgi:hypothetical protein
MGLLEEAIVMKSSPASKHGTIWKRFHDDDRSTLHGRWGMVVLVLWIAAQGFLALS